MYHSAPDLTESCCNNYYTCVVCITEQLSSQKVVAAISARDSPWPEPSRSCCLARNLRNLTVASSQYDILLSSVTLVSDMRHVLEILVPGFSRPVLLCQGRCLRPGGWLHTYEMVTDHFANPNLSVLVAKCWFLGVRVRQNLYVLSLYHNPD